MLKIEQAEEIQLPVRDGTLLSGHLFKPEGSKKWPLIIFITGSGSLSYIMDWQNDSFYLCRTFAAVCLAEGFAVLLVDKRGVGGSKGKWQKQSFYDRAEDMYDVIKLMEKRPNLSENQISVAGHSQGGWIVQLLASMYPNDIKSALSIAGPAYSVREQMVDNMESELIMKGYRRSVKRLLFLYSTSLTLYHYVSTFVKTGFISNILSYDARDVIQAIKVPTYFAFAENDHLVPLEKNEPLARELLKDVNIPWEIRVTKGVNHSYASSAKYQTWDEIESKASPGLADLISDFCKWTRKHTH
ncbi:alpha/beta fold hydrolase [Alkalihalophilus pseudofirmus]|uniref:alpha/beta hydrolase family protein n=1 Tax=Alkalihalophilus pseudofirmus TaxID=79885 RepID=UPI00259B055F|nr:alpha/beta fold hydrolase [Alkalihalophilus pseudofirmus]WEG18971.1 alpha/beta fold hydrolase [Alkalihalophilus pseudofirmus]